MKSLVLLLALAAAAGALQAPLRFYHSAAGIAQAARIRQLEQALDFDGAHRIAGGQAVSALAHPHLGGLLITLTDGRQSVCGASLLSETRAVTAAHCWWDGRNQARSFTVVYGSIYLFRGGTRINTNTVEMHQNYNFRNLRNDIAIITHSRVVFGMTINRIRLPSGPLAAVSFLGYQATAAGYGRTGDNEIIGQQQDKREVTMQVISNAECAAVYGPVTVTTFTLCTSGAGGRSICAGDSGGPLTVGTGLNRILVGVSSFVSESGCARGFPAGFSRITSYLGWIRQRI
ncbi:hypothetical protein ABMA28_003686 [Loxostege sticticalis]|uniref:Peptidase S1 domain-containing protein n=1 Tax=Loxostege sticticalis TaxID=481309 RepID=A0ABD0SSQ9_LOXSC